MKPKPKIDERHNLPSASKVERYFGCPGSFQLERIVPEEEQPSSKVAESGQRIHDARAEQDLSELNLSEADIVTQMAQEEERIYHQWCDDYQITDAEVYQERRVWLRNAGRDVFSCRIDLFAISLAKRMALVLDRKSGRIGVQPPTRNWQLRAELVVLCANYSLVGGRVAIVQPFAKRQPPCDYSPDDIHQKGRAFDQLLELLTKIEDPASPRRIGAWCTYCPAKHICPEAIDVVQKLASLKGLAWASLSPAEKIDLWIRSKLAAKIIEHIHANVRHDTEQKRIPGLGLTEPTFPREVTSAAKCYEVLMKKFGCTPDAFDAMCKITIGKVEAFVAEHLQCSKADAQTWVNENLAEIIAKSEKAGHVKLLEEAA